MVSVGTMIKQLSGLLGKNNLSEWENVFIIRIAGETDGGDKTTGLTETQVGVVESIYGKHFA